jgi:hypothetical protein
MAAKAAQVALGGKAARDRAARAAVTARVVGKVRGARASVAMVVADDAVAIDAVAVAGVAVLSRAWPEPAPSEWTARV